MRARIKQNSDLSATMALVFAAVVLYSLWGGAVLRAQHEARATATQTQLASR